MSKIKKIILGATMLIFIFGAYNTTFAYQDVSFNDFENFIENLTEIDITDNTTFNNNTTVINNFTNRFNNSTGFFIIKNNNRLTNYAGSSVLPTTDEYFILFMNSQTNIINIFGRNNITPNRYTLYNNATGATNMYMYRFKDGKLQGSEITVANSGTYTYFSSWMIENSESQSVFFSEDYSKYFMDEIMLGAANVTFMVKDAQTNGTWSWSLTVPSMTPTPVPWNNGGSSSGGSIGNTETIYDYTNLPWRDYFDPYLHLPKRGLLEYNNNIFYIVAYSGDGQGDTYSIENGTITLEVYKAHRNNSGDIDYYNHYDDKTVSSNNNLYITNQEEPNKLYYAYILQQVFSGDNFLETYYNNADYTFQLSFQDDTGETISKVGPFYFNRDNSFNQYTKEQLQDSNIIWSTDWSEYSNIIKNQNIDTATIDASNFNSLLTSTKAFLSNFLGFFDIFPAWFNTLIALALTVAIVCRIIGR